MIGRKKGVGSFAKDFYVDPVIKKVPTPPDFSGLLRFLAESARDSEGRIRRDITGNPISNLDWYKKHPILPPKVKGRRVVGYDSRDEARGQEPVDLFPIDPILAQIQAAHQWAEVQRRELGKQELHKEGDLASGQVPTDLILWSGRDVFLNGMFFVKAIKSWAPERFENIRFHGVEMTDAEEDYWHRRALGIENVNDPANQDLILAYVRWSITDYVADVWNSIFESEYDAVQIILEEAFYALIWAIITGGPGALVSFVLRRIPGVSTIMQKVIVFVIKKIIKLFGNDALTDIVDGLLDLEKITQVVNLLEYLAYLEMLLKDYQQRGTDADQDLYDDLLREILDVNGQLEQLVGRKMLPLEEQEVIRKELEGLDQIIEIDWWKKDYPENRQP